LRSEITLKDIARETGLSINTVSRALRGKRDISAKTTERVVEAAKTMGYTRNDLASQLRTRKSGILGLVIADIANPVYSGVAKGVEAVAKREGYCVLVSDTEENADKEELAINMMLEKRVDGLLIVPTQQRDGAIVLLRERSYPFVLVGRQYSDLAANCVVNDDVRGGYLAAEYLLSKGHRRIAFIGGRPYISSTAKRVEGYRRALAVKGIEYDPSIVTWSEPSMEGGYAAVRELLLGSKRDWTAVFCFSDLVAAGVMLALRESGLDIPGDVAVVGYDDIEFAPVLYPPLTTVDICKYRMGERGAEMLINYLRANPDSRMLKEVILEPKLVVRDSA
jgi:LacI family transcriptional regulator